MKKYVLLMFLAGVLLSAGRPASEYGIGDAATDFQLPGVGGKKVSLSDFPEAKGYILVFTCNTCPYAKAYEDRIIGLDQKYRALGYPVIAINPSAPRIQPKESMEAMKVRAKEKGFSFPYLQDEGQKIYPQYGATRTPHVFVLQKENGKNLVRYIGAIDNNYEDASQVTERYVEEAVDQLLAGRNVLRNRTVAIGCGIKAG